MDINGVSTSLNTSSSLLTLARPIERPGPSTDKVPEHHRHENHQLGGHIRGRALGIFQQEMRVALKMQFHARFAETQQNYLQAFELISSDDVAAETLGTANRIVAESPTDAVKSIAQLKASVQQAATFARQTVDDSDDTAELDDAVIRVDQGLDDIEQSLAVNRESSASVLDVSTRTKQGSSIRIRTQEGDIVHFDLKRIDTLSASDVAVSGEDGLASSTEVEVSSRSRMVLRVTGDLNESELAAIQNILSQAEEIANEFFDGDIGAAFNLSQGIEFDSEQLAGVNLRFRMQQVSNISYAETMNPSDLRPANPGDALPITDPTEAAPGDKGVPKPPVVGPVAEPVVAVPLDNVPATEQPVVEAPLADTTALSGFFDLVSNFLRSIGDGFAGNGEDGSIRLHYSESFKLDLLRTVIHASAPAEADNAAANAGAIIDSVVDALPASGED